MYALCVRVDRLVLGVDRLVVVVDRLVVEVDRLVLEVGRLQVDRLVLQVDKLKKILYFNVKELLFYRGSRKKKSSFFSGHVHEEGGG